MVGWLKRAAQLYVVPGKDLSGVIAEAEVAVVRSERLPVQARLLGLWDAKAVSANVKSLAMAMMVAASTAGVGVSAGCGSSWRTWRRRAGGERRDEPGGARPGCRRASARPERTGASWGNVVRLEPILRSRASPGSSGPAP
jgi:hypothetical protein